MYCVDDLNRQSIVSLPAILVYDLLNHILYIVGVICPAIPYTRGPPVIAIKRTEYPIYVCLSYRSGIGIGLGDNQRLITILALAVGILLIGVVRLFHTRQTDVNLHLTVASGNPDVVELDAVMSTLSPHTAKQKLLRFDETETAFECTFLVEFQDLEKMNDVRKALRSLSPGIEVTFVDNRGVE